MHARCKVGMSVPYPAMEHQAALTLFWELPQHPRLVDGRTITVLVLDAFDELPGYSSRNNLAAFHKVGMIEGAQLEGGPPGRSADVKKSASWEEWIAHRNFDPIRPLADDCLLELAAAAS